MHESHQTVRLLVGTDLGSAGPQDTIFLGPYAGVTCLDVCLKRGNVCLSQTRECNSSYVWRPLKIYLLRCRLWFYDCLRPSKAFSAFFSRTNDNAIFSWNL